MSSSVLVVGLLYKVVSSSVDLEYSLHWKFRSENEKFTLSETEVLVELSLIFLLGINVFYLPSLSSGAISGPHSYVGSFSVFSVGNIKNLLGLDIDEESTLILE